MKCAICQKKTETMTCYLPERWQKQTGRTHADLCFNCAMTSDGNYQTGEASEQKLRDRESLAAHEATGVVGVDACYLFGGADLHGTSALAAHEEGKNG